MQKTIRYAGVLFAFLLLFANAACARPALVFQTDFGLKDGAVFGNIPVLDVQYGNVWSSVGKALFDELNPEIGAKYEVAIFRNDEEVFKELIPYANTFGDVLEGEPLLYFNSLMNLSLALNKDSFAGMHGISSGPEWSISVRSAEKPSHR